jgi:divinyl chlorophyllide a 8-vinyl-reductase
LSSASTSKKQNRVLVFGATGTIGRATVEALLRDGYDVTCLVRKQTELGDAKIQIGEVTSLEPDAFAGEKFDAIISCLASRTGAPDDAWAIDHDAHVKILDAAKRAGVKHFVLLSAICVQKPKLAFQHAKLAFEGKLKSSGLTWSIVRPTAYFKSLSGQVERVKAGKPFLVFGDGKRTSCKPISDNDLASYLVRCLDDKLLHNRILPIGGPGPAITPLDQAQQLFALLGREPKLRHVPVALLDVIIAALRVGRLFYARASEKAELARIGKYYATESMLVWDDKANRYDADATPETGTETLRDYYQKLIDGTATAERGEHAVF